MFSINQQLAQRFTQGVARPAAVVIRAYDASGKAMRTSIGDAIARNAVEQNKGSIMQMVAAMRQYALASGLDRLQLIREVPAGPLDLGRSSGINVRYRMSFGSEVILIAVGGIPNDDEDEDQTEFQDDLFFGGYIGIVNSNAQIDDVLRVSLNGTVLGLADLGVTARRAYAFRFGSRALRDPSPQNANNPFLATLTRPTIPPRPDGLKPPYFILKPQDFNYSELITTEFEVDDGSLRRTGGNTLRLETATSNDNGNFGHVYVEFYSRKQQNIRLVSQSVRLRAPDGRETIRVNDRPMYWRWTYDFGSGESQEFTFDLNPETEDGTVFSEQPGYA